MSEAVVIGRLKVRTFAAPAGGAQRAGASPDPLLLRLRASHLLETADLTPSRLAPGAILCIRTLADPLPGRLSLDARQLAPDRAWQASLTTQLDSLASQAERPLQHAVGSSAKAVLFADQGEMLACLALDWLAGQLLNRWWWRQVVRNTQLTSAVVGAWLEALDAAPEGLAHLSRRNEAVAFVGKLADGDVDRLLTGLVERHRLRALGEVAANAARGAPGAPGPGDWPWPAARPAERPAVMAPPDDLRPGSGTGGADEEPSPRRGGPARGPAAPPWQAIVPADSAGLSKPRQLLLGIGLGLVYAPNAVRSKSYAEQAARWYEGRAAEPPARRAASPFRREAPARGDPTGERGPGEPADTGLGEAPLPESGQTESRAAHTAAARPEEAKSAARSGRARQSEGAALSPEDGRTEVAAEESAPAAVPHAVESAEAAAWEDAALEVIEVTTGYAGLFYLVNVAIAMGFYADFTQPEPEGELELSIWAFLALIGRQLIGDELAADAAWRLLARLAGAGEIDKSDAAAAVPEEVFTRDFIPPDVGSVAEWVETTAGQVYERIVASFDVSVADQPVAGRGELAAIAFSRGGRVRISAGRLDVVLRLDELDVAVRLAGLDRNPGWVPAAGRTITFYYE